VCVCSLRYPACNAPTQCCYLWPVRPYNIFPPYLVRDTIFERKLLDLECVLIFPTALPERFIILRRNDRDMILKMCIGLHVKYPVFVSDFDGTPIFWAEFRKRLKFKVSWKSVQWEPSCPIGLVYTGRVTRPSETGPVTRPSNSTLPLFPCCCSHDTIIISQ